MLFVLSDLWNESQILKKSKRKTDPFSSDRRKKPVTVSGPYIVYMLKDVDVIDDWTAIKKVRKLNFDFVAHIQATAKIQLVQVSIKF